LRDQASTQLYGPERYFSLWLTGERLLFTDAAIVHYDPRYIVNAFSTENSLTRLQPKRGSLPGTDSGEIERWYGEGAVFDFAAWLERSQGQAGGLVSFRQDRLTDGIEAPSDLLIVE
jgi:hypothetical protein